MVFINSPGDKCFLCKGKYTLCSAAWASISCWCKPLRSEGFAENPNCSLQFPVKAKENGCEFPCSSSSGATHVFKQFKKVGRPCWDNSSGRQAQPSTDRSSGQQISAFNPWRVPRASSSPVDAEGERYGWEPRGVWRDPTLVGYKSESFGMGQQPAIFWPNVSWQRTW